MMLRRWFVISSGSAIAMIAAMALLGYVYGVTALTDWHGVIPMAIPTAVCFLLTGAAFVAVGTEPELGAHHPFHV